MRLALVVGVDTYQHQQTARSFLQPLQYAENDASAMAEHLTQLGFKVICLKGTQATAAKVQAAFGWLQGTTSADPHPNSCFVFHFSGHGSTDPNNEEIGYLLLHDTDPHEMRALGLEMTSLVYHRLPQVRVPISLVLLDACHSGYAAGVKDLSDKPHLSNVAQQLFSGLHGRMILTACAGEARTREDDRLRHGVFTYHVLRHWRDLDGAPPSGLVTFGSLVDYVGQRIASDHPEVPLPVYNGVGKGGTIILRYSSATTPPPLS
jgi:uncharacterized caspase-like protein